MTPDLLIRAVGCPDIVAATYAPLLAETFGRFAIDSRKRTATFLAHVGHESRGLTATQESLYFSKPETVATLFRKYFDTNKDGAFSPEELAVAAQYTKNPQKLANKVYANRMGNGDEASGDGYRHRGMGLIQVTGKENQTACLTALGLDPTKPEVLAAPSAAALSAGWFWDTRKLNELADADQFEAITRKINGGTNGMEDRLSRWARAKAALGIS